MAIPRFVIKWSGRARRRVESLPNADTSVFAQAMMYMVCDGHGGSKAAKFAAANMHRYLVSKLPQQLPNFSVQQGAGMQITGWCTA